jgi:two-component system NtrC family sensor kinase
MRNIVVIIISVSVIPLILVSSTIYYEKVYAHLRVLVQNHTNNIDSFLREKLGDIRFLADSFDYNRLTNEAFLRERLAVLQKDYGPVFVDLGVINADGEQIAYAGPFKLEKAQYSDAEWFQQVMQRQYFISDVFLGLRGLPHFIIAVKTSRDGHTWIFRSTIDFVAFNTLVESMRLGKTGFAIILNKEGKLQTTPISKPSLDTIPAKSIYAEFLANPVRSADKVRIAVKPDISDEKTIFVASSLKNGDWLLVYQQHFADAFADLNKTFTITTIMMLLGPLCIIIMAIDEEKQLMNVKVVETGKLASVGELAAGVAHEINNPVAIMVEEAGWIGDLLEDEEMQNSKNLAEFRRAIGQIKDQGKRCKEITQKLLSFARKTDATVQDVEINEVLEELVALSAQRAKYALVTIQTHFHDNLPQLKLSLSELQQVFLNLINNALDAMEAKGGTLTIDSRLENSRILVEVSDTGMGIPESNLNRIFDPFYTTKPVGKGTGLGLSICYGIIDKMGGKIEVRSAVGQGTTFAVYLPVPAEDTGAPA